MDKQLLEELVDFKKWETISAKGRKFNLFDYVFCISTPDLLFAFGELFYPRLVIHDGLYFLEDHFSISNYESWKEKLTDKTEIQKVMNHIHIRSLFQNSDVSDELSVKAAEFIAELWTKVFSDKGLIGKAFGSSFENSSVTIYNTP